MVMEMMVEMVKPVIPIEDDKNHNHSTNNTTTDAMNDSNEEVRMEKRQGVDPIVGVQKSEW